MKYLWYNAVVEERGGLYALARWFFVLLSLVYGLAIALRRLVYWLGIAKPAKLPCRVISVGNISVGGTGKTPLVAYLAKLLSQSGKRVGILARGYGKIEAKDTNVITDDEALVPDIPNVVRVAQPDRLSAGRKLCAEQNINSIILDDGFQHWRIKRNVDIVVIDSVNPFGHKRLLPAGILREPLGQLKRADMFVLTHCNFVVPEMLNRLEQFLSRYNKPIVKTVHQPVELVAISGQAGQMDNLVKGGSARMFELSNGLAGQRVWGFCGIGSPGRFRATLNELSELAGFDYFPDHHIYSQTDIDNIIDRARKADARMLVTTQKDALRLKAITGIDRVGLPIYYLRIELKIIDGEDALSKALNPKSEILNKS
ncbi:MAG: tetraacyldisaccharide 4'-kinase [Candidatus Brocadiia bacterium]